MRPVSTLRAEGPGAAPTIEGKGEEVMRMKIAIVIVFAGTILVTGLWGGTVLQAGEKKEEATFVRVVTWDKRAEVCNEYLKKGSPVCIEGRLQSRSWEAQDGTKRSTIEVIANSVQFLSRGSGAKTSEDVSEDIQFSEEPQPTGEGSMKENSNEEEVPF